MTTQNCQTDGCASSQSCYSLPNASQAFPAPLPDSIPANIIGFKFVGACPANSGLTLNDPAAGNVAAALWEIEKLLCTLNPTGIATAGDCKWLITKGGKVTPANPLDALQCLPPGAPGDVILSTGTGWVIGPAQSPETPLTTTDSTTVKLTPGPSGNGHTGLTAAVIVDPVTGNALVAGPAGLSVVLPPETPLVATAGPGLTAATSGTAGHTLALDLKVDPDPKNILSVGPAGLLVLDDDIAETPLTTTDTSSIKLIPGPTGNGHTGVSATVILDPAANNALTIGPNGLLVTPAADGTSVTNTNTVKMTMVGTQIKSDVIIDPGKPDNILTAGPNGLYVPAFGCADLLALLDPATSCIPQNVDAPATVLSLTGGVLAYRTLPAAPTLNPLTISGSNGLTLTAGTGGQSLTGVAGALVIDPVAGNLISVGPAGLKALAPAPTCAQIKTALTSAGCIPAGTLAQNIGFDAAGNLIQAAPPASAALNPLTVTDSSTIDLTTGTGAQSLTGLTAVVKVSATAGNTITINADGLFVPPPTCAQVKTALTSAGCVPVGTLAQNIGFDAGGNLIQAAPAAGAVLSPLTVTDSSTIDLTAGTGSQNLTGVTAVVKVDPAAGNTLVANPNGLFVPPATIDCPTIITKVSTVTGGGCIPLDAGVCTVPDRVLGYTAGGAPLAWKPRDMYVFEASPVVQTTLSVFSNTQSTINDVDGAFWKIDHESGLCGSPSWWDATTGRLTIGRAGLYKFDHTLFIRLVKAALANTAGTATSNSAIYIGARFVRPAGTVNGRPIIAYANTIRAYQTSLFLAETGTGTLATNTMDFLGTGTFTRLCTVGTQYSLRAVCTTGGNAAGVSTPIISFVAKGDSGSMHVAEQPLTSYSF